MNATLLLGVALLLTPRLGGGHALGADPYIYPNQGQSAEQQSRDRYECHTWAAQRTGVDFTEKTLSTTEAAQKRRTTPIKNIEQFDGI
jgi:hypothetical protein